MGESPGSDLLPCGTWFLGESRARVCACLCMCVLGRVCACVLVCLRVCSGVCTSVHAHVCRGQRRMSGALLSNSAPGPHETGSLTKPGTGVRPASSRVTLPSQPSAPKCRFWPHPDFLFYSGNFIHVYNEMSSCPSPLPSIHFPVLPPPPPRDMSTSQLNSSFSKFI